MKIRKRISLWLRTFYQQYKRIPGFLGFAVSVMIILAMATAFVRNPQYWIAALDYQPFFVGPDAVWRAPDWHTWRVFLLIELILAGSVLLSCRVMEYGQSTISKWCLGWLIIPLVIFAWRFISWTIDSYLGWQFQISLGVADIADVFFYTTLLMTLSQLPLAFIIAKFGVEAEYERQ